MVLAVSIHFVFYMSDKVVALLARLMEGDLSDSFDGRLLFGILAALTLLSRLFIRQRSSKRRLRASLRL